ncbi:hypothetical protein [Streptomyces sp. NPDC004533]|uniref:hypothetical protein n=1 Tax=Streptomyces sp. NPDC004533 TaxID=3154278 RepID=UPI0033ACA74D
MRDQDDDDERLDDDPGLNNGFEAVLAVEEIAGAGKLHRLAGQPPGPGLDLAYIVTDRSFAPVAVLSVALQQRLRNARADEDKERGRPP